ncbi:FCD domain-containing protein [Streptomyces sp. NPDC008150]|uniref:GntR family transcriptional regulator n=1 Tax=Streptomyces sp. NPDC008150 TaxID=3364816 RepID=UPI0036EA30FE
MTGGAAGTPRVKPLSLVEKVTREIRRSILAAELRPGQEFSLREIADRLGISNIPVREALRQLESQGLVVTTPGRSATVAPLSREDLRAVYRLRRQIEPELAARACLLLTGPGHTQLVELLAALADASLDADEVYEAHHRFHLELLRPAATGWDLRVLGVLWHAAERYVQLSFGARVDDPDEPRRREAAHALLLDAVLCRDPRLAAQAVTDHLDANERLALEGIAGIAGITD